MNQSIARDPAAEKPAVVDAASFLRACKRVVRRILEQILGGRIVERLPYSRVTYRLVAWSTAVPPAVAQQLAAHELTFRRGQRRDIEALEKEDVYDDCEIYREWLDEGQWLVVADENGMPVTYSWLDFAPSFQLEDLPEYRFEPGRDVCYSHEAWTMPSHRGRSLRRHVFATELLLAQAAGKRWVLGYQFEGPAIEDVLRNFERIGIPRGTVVADVRVVQLLGLRLTRRRTYGHDDIVRVLPIRSR